MLFLGVVFISLVETSGLVGFWEKKNQLICSMKEAQSPDFLWVFMDEIKQAVTAIWSPHTQICKKAIIGFLKRENLSKLATITLVETESVNVRERISFYVISIIQAERGTYVLYFLCWPILDRLDHKLMWLFWNWSTHLASRVKNYRTKIILFNTLSLYVSIIKWIHLILFSAAWMQQSSKLCFVPCSHIMT